MKLCSGRRLLQNVAPVNPDFYANLTHRCLGFKETVLNVSA
jgi:hypothetical protein